MFLEIETRLLKAWPEPPCSINLEKVDQLGSEVLNREAYTILHEMEPLYRIIQDMSEFKEGLMAFLRQHGQISLALTVQQTPGLLAAFMEVTSNAVRMHLLARHMPYKQIIQLYTLVYATVEMQENQMERTPPDMRAVISYAQAFPKILILLQSQFQPVTACIGQVLEATACKAVLALGNSSAMRSSGLLEMTASASKFTAAGDVSATMDWGMLEWLPRLKEWSLLAFLICPGELIRPGAQQVLHMLLQETFRMPVYREHCEWVHPLYEAHVRPTLVTFYNTTKSGMERADRKALDRMSKRLIEEALKGAISGCVEEHRKRRVLLTNALQRMVTLMGQRPSEMADRAEPMLAVLSCARAEVLWWFQHWEEMVPRSGVQSLLSSSDPLRELTPADGLPALVSAMGKAEDLLLTHKGLIARQAAAATQEALDSCPLNIEAHMSSSFNAELQVIFATLQLLHNSPQLTREDAGVSVHTSWTPYPTEPDLEAARAACERLHSETIFPAASTSGAAPSWGAEAAAHTDGSLSGLCALLQKTRLIDGLDSSIARAASLHRLAFCYLRGDPRQLKLRTAMLASLEPPYRDIEHVVAWLHALSWLGHAPDQDTSDSCAAAAGTLATELMYAVAETFRQLVTHAHKALSAITEGRPQAADGAGKGAKQSRSHGLLQDIRNILDSLDDVHSHATGSQEQEGLDGYNSLLLALKRLSVALSTSDAVQIHGDLVLEPANQLVAAARATFQYLLSSFAFTDKELQRPVLLEGAVRRLLDIYSALQEVSGCNFLGIAKEVLANNAYSPLPQQPPETIERLIAFIGEWFVQTIVMDGADIGISFSISRQTFYSSRGSILAEYACEAELRALVRTFGLYSAREIGACTERPIAEAVSGLLAMLTSNEEPLSRLHTDYKVHNSCVEACAAAAAGFADLHAVVDRCRLLARCLFLRRLLAGAAASKAAALLPRAAASLEASALAAAGCSGPHACDLLDLPRPPFPLANDAAADPVLTRLIAAGGCRAWRHWPLLVALTLWSPVWASATYSPKQGALANNMDYLAVVVPDLALAAAAAEAREGGVDREGCPTPAEAVRCFVRCASASLAARDDGAFSSRALALRRLAEAAHARGLLDADEALQTCHLAQ
ncbi:probable Nck-associated protein 1 at N-terminal half [Coccomyxa sp. Obi]|nr:probable Nck-associated protein 1 at N-terminal half [Coccomyxa sp. Obi]